MKRIIRFSSALLLCTFVSLSFAEHQIPIYLTAEKNSGATVGTIVTEDSKYGLLLTPNLHGLPPGTHGFHIHTNFSCEMSGMAAGGHLDPANTGKHLGPYNNGHLGDLPVLIVDSAGNATLPLLAPRLKESDILGRAIMIHLGSDNYSDTPLPLGGAGARLACGVIK